MFMQKEYFEFREFLGNKFEAIQGLSSALFSLLNSFYSAKLRQGHTRGRKWGIQSIILSFFLCPVDLGGNFTRCEGFGVCCQILQSWFVCASTLPREIGGR